MRKRTENNFRVEVTPATDWRGIATAADAEECAEQIRRHVDNSDVHVLSDVALICEHCGALWTEDSATYNGGCCDKDEAANPNHVEATHD